MNRVARRFLLSAGVMLMSSLTMGDTPGGRPVVVELFESQGCSSCPPAESAVQVLQKELGRSIVVLVFHVDYWDHPWKDTFSDARYTQRQSDYARTFGDSTIYTPEMVVQGEVGFVGSDLGRARDEIRRRLEGQRSTFSLNYAPSSASDDAGVLHFVLPADLAQQAKQLTLVLIENAPPVHVERGENAGVTMSGDNAVRTLWTIPLNPTGNYRVPVHHDHAWDPRNMSAAILIQGDSSRILAAEEVPL
jgi:hypothetical protein